MKKLMTNADRIRNMTDEQLAEFIRKLKLVSIASERVGMDIKSLGSIEWLKREQECEQVTE